MHTIKKSYPHSLGLSAVFRQWRADSHCRFLHGYALSFDFIFEAEKLDKNGWVLDFGSLKPLKEVLVTQFDHKTLIAESDPHIEEFLRLRDMDLIDLHVMPRVGCEAFAEWAHDKATKLLEHSGEMDLRQVRCVLVVCHEHEANSASYSPFI
jgi:6-pyruvoyltetrahydropterin/6-carboxytetrahydropterin synthase